MNFQDRKPFFTGFLVIALGGAFFYALQPYVPQRLFAETTASDNIVVDSLMLQAMNEPVLVEENVTDSKNIRETSADSTRASQSSSARKKITYSPARLMQVSDFNFKVESVVDTAGMLRLPNKLTLQGYNGADYLQDFYQKLYQIEKKPNQSLRIAYYGDSMIDGDLIVQDLRSALQDRFGGRGVGFVSIDSESARSRYSVKQSATGNWKQINYMKTVSDSLNYGVNGAVFYAEDSTARISFNASGIKNSYRLNAPRLFYGKGTDTTYLITKTDQDTITNRLPLNGKKPLNLIRISSKNLKKIDLNFSQAVGLPLYGVDFFNQQGVTIDGFSNRGNSGLPLSLLKADFIKEFQKELDYDLIILQFGANVLSTERKSFNWYATRMTKVVDHIKTLYPNAAILVLGTADKGTKIEDRIQTDTTVVRLLRSQQEYAAATGSGFMSLFHLMGGVNSMPAWEQHGLANSDFTHFSPKGSRKIGKLIYDELMLSYDVAVDAFAKAEQLKESTALLKEKNIQNNAISAQKPADSILTKGTQTQQIPIKTQNDSLKSSPK